MAKKKTKTPNKGLIVALLIALVFVVVMGLSEYSLSGEVSTITSARTDIAKAELVSTEYPSLVAGFGDRTYKISYVWGTIDYVLKRPAFSLKPALIVEQTTTGVATVYTRDNKKYTRIPLILRGYSPPISGTLSNPSLQPSSQQNQHVVEFTDSGGNIVGSIQASLLPTETREFQVEINVDMAGAQTIYAVTGRESITTPTGQRISGSMYGYTIQMPTIITERPPTPTPTPPPPPTLRSLTVATALITNTDPLLWTPKNAGIITVETRASTDDTFRTIGTVGSGNTAQTYAVSEGAQVRLSQIPLPGYTFVKYNLNLNLASFGGGESSAGTYIFSMPRYASAVKVGYVPIVTAAPVPTQAPIIPVITPVSTQTPAPTPTQTPTIIYNPPSAVVTVPATVASTPVPPTKYISAYFQTGSMPMGLSGSRIRVLKGTSVDLYVTISGQGTGTLKTLVKRDMGTLSDIKRTFLTTTTLDGQQTYSVGTFQADDAATTYDFIQYYIKIYWNDQLIYNPTDRDRREAVYTYVEDSAPAPTAVALGTATPTPQPPNVVSLNTPTPTQPKPTPTPTSTMPGTTTPNPTTPTKQDAGAVLAPSVTPVEVSVSAPTTETTIQTPISASDKEMSPQVQSKTETVYVCPEGYALGEENGKPLCFEMAKATDEKPTKPITIIIVAAIMVLVIGYIRRRKK